MDHVQAERVSERVADVLRSCGVPNIVNGDDMFGGVIWLMKALNGNQKGVAQERTGWRDVELSIRRRSWGPESPSIDIDHLLVEYDRCMPVALIEYKHERAQPWLATSAGYRTLQNLGGLAGLPVFEVRYSDDYGSWWIKPLNALAGELAADLGSPLTESQYVGFLQGLRGQEQPVETEIA